MQRHALLMFTSCGWFFDEISGIETVQILQYACRAIQLAESESDVKLLDKFESILEEAKSNIFAYGTGKDIYNHFVLPSRLSLSKVGMHYAVNSLFDESPETLGILNYSAKSEYFERLEFSGTQKVAIAQNTGAARALPILKNNFISLLFTWGSITLLAAIPMS